MMRNRLQQGDTACVRVRGGSMQPLLRQGDEVLLTFAAADTLTRGDIITFLTKDGLLTHRFWAHERVNGRLLLHTRGDNNRQPDALHAAEALVGRVIARRRSGQLALNQGAGAWLNRRLTRLAAAEAQRGSLFRRAAIHRKKILIILVTLIAERRS